LTIVDCIVLHYALLETLLQLDIGLIETCST